MAFKEYLKAQSGQVEQLRSPGNKKDPQMSSGCLSAGLRTWGGGRLWRQKLQSYLGLRVCMTH